VECCEELANLGKIVIVAALDGTFQRVGFGNILNLIPLAESVVKLSAVCMVCFGNASFTKRTCNETKVCNVELCVEIANYVIFPKFVCSGPLTCFKISSKCLTVVEETKGSITLIATPSFNTVLRQFSLPFIITILKIYVNVILPFLIFQLAAF
jgi:hypothetical protein